MDIGDIIKALDPKTAGEYTRAQRDDAALTAIGVIARHLRWNDDCRPLIPSTAEEAWERNKHFANSQTTALECFEAICACACDYDGYCERFGLAGLIDELWALAMQGCNICRATGSGAEAAYQAGYEAGKLASKFDVESERKNAAHVAARLIKEKMIDDGLTPPGWLVDFQSRKELFKEINAG